MTNDELDELTELAAALANGLPELGLRGNHGFCTFVDGPDAGNQVVRDLSTVELLEAVSTARGIAEHLAHRLAQTPRKRRQA